MLDLKQLYKILDYSYNQRERKHGESVCLVIVPPAKIAEQYSYEGKATEDTSPHHITVAYLGDVPLQLEDKVVGIAKQVCEQTRHFSVKLGGIGLFENEKHNVYYSKVRGKKLHNLHESLKNTFAMNQIQINQKHPIFEPHITTEYVLKNEAPKFKRFKPQGKWTVENVWLWGFQQPHLLFLK